jgi:hypothetical protein
MMLEIPIANASKLVRFRRVMIFVSVLCFRNMVLCFGQGSGVIISLLGALRRFGVDALGELTVRSLPSFFYQGVNVVLRHITMDAQLPPDSCRPQP